MPKKKAEEPKKKPAAKKVTRKKVTRKDVVRKTPVKNKFEDIQTPSLDVMNEIKKDFENRGFKVRIGG